MQIKPRMLCPVTDWEPRIVVKGPNHGKTFNQRYWIGANKWNFFLAIEREGEPEEKWQQYAYFGRMASLLPSLAHLSRDMKTSVNNIVSELVKRTGKTPECNLKSPLEDLEHFGKFLDDEFDINFLKPYPPKCYYTLFAKELEIDPATISVDEKE